MERIGAATYYVLTSLRPRSLPGVYILLALKLSALMTGLVFLCGCGLMFLLRGKTKVAHETGEGLSEAMSRLYNAVSEHLGGMKIAKSYGAEQRHVDVFGKLAEQVRSMYTDAIRNQAEVNYWFNIGSVLILSIILYVSLQILSIPTAGVLLIAFPLCPCHAETFKHPPEFPVPHQSHAILFEGHGIDETLRRGG